MATHAPGAVRICVSLVVAACLASRAHAEPEPSRAESRELETTHFHISYNTGDIFARKRADIFEELYTTLTAFLKAEGLSFSPTTRRMEVLLLATRREYELATKGAPVHIAHGEGFYSPKKRLAVFFNRLEDPDYLAKARTISAQELKVQRLRAQLGFINTPDVVVHFGDGRQRTMSKVELQSMIGTEERELGALRTRLLAGYDRDNERTTLHECAHQLIHNLDAAPIGDGTPLWLIEGLATFFEAARSGDLRQPATVSRGRLLDYRAAEQTGKLVTLERLITDDQPLLGEDNVSGYAQSWALVHYLLHEHPDRLKRYIQRLRADTAPASARKPARRLADFKSAFGNDLAVFEASWIAYVTNLR